MMIDFGDQIVVNLGRGVIKDELHSCEFGSYEDHIRNVQCEDCEGTGSINTRIHAGQCLLCKGDGYSVERQEPYDKGRLHIVELIQRDKSKTLVSLKTEEEVNEFFVHACTGTFGLYHLSVLQRIYKQLAPFVDAGTKARITYGSLGH